MVPAASDRIPRVPPYSGNAPDTAPLPVRASHPLRTDFPDGSGSWLCHHRTPLLPRRRLDDSGLGSSPFARHYSGNRFFLSSPAGTKMFQFPALAPASQPVHGIRPCGFPHSDSHGSLPVCGSPWIFAAYRVLHRSRKPRHPPFALLLFLSSRVTFRITLRLFFLLVEIATLCFSRPAGLTPRTAPQTVSNFFSLPRSLSVLSMIIKLHSQLQHTVFQKRLWKVQAPRDR